MKTLAAILLTLALGTSASFAQEEEVPEVDPFDLSSIESQIQEFGLPTVQHVSQLEETAVGLFENGNCEDALAALESFAKNANWLANMISSGLEPYYSASYSDREDYPFRQLRPLIPIESKSNELRRKRDEAFVMQAECNARLGSREQAVALYLKALDLIGLENEEWWARARSGLFDIIGMELE